MANPTRGLRATATTCWCVPTFGTALAFRHRHGYYGRGGRHDDADEVFTANAETVCVQTLVRVAEVRTDASSSEQARTIVSRLAVTCHPPYGMTSIATLRAPVTHAHPVLVPGRATAAASEIPRTWNTCRRLRAFLTPGRLGFLLARAQMADSATGTGTGTDAIAAAQTAVRLVRSAGRAPVEKPGRPS